MIYASVYPSLYIYLQWYSFFSRNFHLLVACFSLHFVLIELRLLVCKNVYNVISQPASRSFCLCCNPYGFHHFFCRNLLLLLLSKPSLRAGKIMIIQICQPHTRSTKLIHSLIYKVHSIGWLECDKRHSTYAHTITNRIHFFIFVFIPFQIEMLYLMECRNAV